MDGALRQADMDLTELALPLLVNTLASLPERIVLVLDDYHEIVNIDVHQSVEFLIDHLPPMVALALAGRSDPPLALARRRARAELVEVRSADLRLSIEEATALLNRSLSLDLTPEQVDILRKRTEGWAAGLQLVGLSLRGHQDRGGYIAAFAGDDRQIVDYLGAEVLAGQSPNTREFHLTHLGVGAPQPGRCAMRCLRVATRGVGWWSWSTPTCSWFRWMSAAAGIATTTCWAISSARELALAEPDVIPSLHRRACEWHRREGMLAEAITHAIAAGEHAQAAELIAANWLEFVNRGELATVEAWTRMVPAREAKLDSRLCLARAGMLVVLGRPAEIEAEVQAAERGKLPGPVGRLVELGGVQRRDLQNPGAADARRRGRGCPDRGDRLRAGA